MRYYKPHTELCHLRDLMWFSWWQLDDRHNRKLDCGFKKLMMNQQVNFLMSNTL